MKQLENYIHYYESLTPTTVAELKALVTSDIHFRDPFNDVRSAEAMVRIMAKMFEDVINPKFKIIEQAINGNIAFLKWQMNFLSKGRHGKAFAICGISEVRFAESGLVCEHLDYWDPAATLYEQIPVLGWVLRRLKSRLTAS